MLCLLRVVGTAFLVSFPLLAGESFVAGRVVDENNTGVSGAQVSLSAGAITVRTASDATGAFRLHVPAGDYSATAEHDGYFPLRPRQVRLDEGPQELHLVLNHLREVFQSVKVEGGTTPLDVAQTGQRQTLSGLNILDTPYPSTHDVRNAMKLIPGVVQDARGTLHFSGSSENQVLYTLDGFDVGDPLTGNFATRLNVDMVRSLEYSTGRYSPEFGKGSAGALQIRTDMGDDTLRYTATNFIPGIDTHFGLHVGTWTPRFGLSGPIIKGRAWFSESVDGEYSDLIVPDLPKSERSTSSRRLGDLLRTQVNLGRRHILFGSFLVNTWNAPESGLGALTPPPTTTDQRTRTWFFSIKDQIYVARGTLLELGLGEDRTFARQIPQGQAFYQIRPEGRAGNYFVDSTQNSRRDQLISNFFLPSFHLLGEHQLKAGSDLDRLNFEQTARRTGYDLIGLGGYVLSQTTFAGPDRLTRPGLEMSTYLLDTWRIRSNLTADLGMRQDWDELIRRVEPSPRLSLAWSPFPARHTRIAGGYAVTYDETYLALFAQARDQYSITTSFNPDGTVARPPVATMFVIPSARLAAPRFENWTLEVGEQLPRRTELTFDLLRRRGKNGLTYAAAAGPVTPEQPATAGILELTNLRRDTYDSAQVTVRQALGTQYEWMASYTRSLAQSNSVLALSVDQPLSVTNNVGPLPWDSPNRFLGWFYLPTPWQKWAVAGMVEARDGFPFSVQKDDGSILGEPDSRRFPVYFSLNFHVEYRFAFRGMRLALRAGFNNITDHNNYTEVNSTFGAPGFLTYYGSDGRHFVLRIRWLGKE